MGKTTSQGERASQSTNFRRYGLLARYQLLEDENLSIVAAERNSLAAGTDLLLLVVFMGLEHQIVNVESSSLVQSWYPALLVVHKQNKWMIAWDDRP